MQRQDWRRSIYEEIRVVMQSQGVLGIERMCQATGVSRAGFYRGWEEKAPDEAAMALRDAIQRASVEYPRYGAAKVAEVVRRGGLVVSVARVQRVRREDNLLAVRRRKFVVTTDSDHEFLVYPNLAQYMVLTAVNQLWVADITYIRLASEFVYLAVVLDAFSRRVVGWSLSRSLQTKLPLAALNLAITTRQPAPGLVHHSDRGSQYASDDYVGRLENSKMEELERNIEDFIERYYNQVRLHAALGYCSPVEFEQRQVAIEAKPERSELPAALSFRRHREIYPDAVSKTPKGRRR